MVEEYDDDELAEDIMDEKMAANINTGEMEMPETTVGNANKSGLSGSLSDLHCLSDKPKARCSKFELPIYSKIDQLMRL